MGLVAKGTYYTGPGCTGGTRAEFTQTPRVLSYVGQTTRIARTWNSAHYPEINITAEFDDCYVVGVYVPNAQPELARIGFRQAWDRAAFTAFIDDKVRGFIAADALDAWFGLFSERYLSARGHQPLSVDSEATQRVRALPTK